MTSYYGQPVIKEPVWTWEIPCYFFAGGLAGASAGMAWLAGDSALGRRCWLISLGAVTASPVLLTMDLGKPARFFNMLRVFKVTSPMSVGSWVLTGSGLTTSVAALNAWTGLLPGCARVAQPAAAVLGLPLATYTAALAANTAVPVWHEARRELPFVFASGAAASAGAAVLMVTPVRDAAPARRLTVGGAAAELGFTWAMEKRLGGLGEPYHSGIAGKLGKAAKGLTAAGGLLVGLGARRSRALAVGGAGLVLAGAFAERWSIFKAGFASAADPKYTVEPQRERVSRGEGHGASQRDARGSAAGSGSAASGSPATPGSPATAG